MMRTHQAYPRVDPIGTRGMSIPGSNGISAWVRPVTWCGIIILCCLHSRMMHVEGMSLGRRAGRGIDVRWWWGRKCSTLERWEVCDGGARNYQWAMGNRTCAIHAKGD